MVYVIINRVECRCKLVENVGFGKWNWKGFSCKCCIHYHNIDEKDHLQWFCAYVHASLDHKHGLDTLV